MSIYVYMYVYMYVYKVCYNIESRSLFVEYLESELSEVLY